MPVDKRPYSVFGLLKSVRSQRTQYKPYDYDLDFSTGENNGLQTRVYVKMEIPKSSVVTENNYFIVIDMDGFTTILEKCADAVDKLTVNYEKKVRK